MARIANRKRQRFTRAFLNRTLAGPKARYEATGNPFEVVDAYRMSRLMRLQPPPWVQAYMDEAVQRLWSLVAYPENAKDLNRAVAKAFGMASDGPGRGTVLSEYLDTRWIAFGYSVAQYLKDGGQETHAFQIVGEAEGVSPSTVRRAWKRYKADPRFQKSANF
jgi:hypothetical protein